MDRFQIVRFGRAAASLRRGFVPRFEKPENTVVLMCGGWLRAACWLRGGVALALGVVVHLGGSGCSTLKEAQADFRQGDLAAAEEGLKELADREGMTQADSVIVHLEYGSVLHHTGRLEKSTQVFERVEARLAEIDRAAELRVSDEAAGLLLNPRERRYIGTPYDRVMAPFYRGLNAMLLGDLETPRQAFVAMAQAQRDALNQRAKQIEDAERQADREQPAYARSASVPKASGRWDVRRSMNSPQATRAFESRYGELQRYEPYAEFAVPVADLLRAIYLLGARRDAGDADLARTNLRKLAQALPNNAFVRDDFALAEEAVRGEAVDGWTYVLFATGVAPSRETFRLDLPLFTLNDEVDYVGVAFPYLAFHGDFIPHLRVFGDAAAVRTALVTDFDRIVSADFNAELPNIISRALLSSATKTAAAWAINEGSGRQDFVRILTAAYQVWQNQADDRTWATLPKQFQYARLPTPASGVVRLTARDGLDIAVEVESDGVNLIYVRSVRPGVPPIVYHVVLQ